MPVYNYTVSDFTPFTKIVSADVNSKFTSVKTWINWDGSGTTSGLADSNIQSNSVSGGGLTRATKLKLGTAKSFVVNDSTGALADLTAGNNKTIYTDGSGVMTAGTLPLIAGGTGVALTVGVTDDVLKVVSGALAFGSSPMPPQARVFSFYNFG
jgi:hypothetical protein